MPSGSTTKNIYCANVSDKPYALKVSWSESSPSVTNNTSVISVSGSLGASNISFNQGSSNSSYLELYWYDNKRATNTLVKKSAAFYSCGMSYGTRTVSGSITVTHNDDGSLSGYAWIRFTSGSTSGGWAPGSSDAKPPGSTTLTTIARASSISSVTSSNSMLGTAVTINISRKSSSFTHKVEWTFENSTWATITSSAATSASFTPPISLATRIPNTTVGKLTVRVTTYSGSTKIGSSVSKSINLYVPSSVVPTMNTPTVTRVNGSVPSAWGVYVKGYSKATIAISGAAGAQGSTIKSYSISGPGLKTSSSSGTTNFLTKVGTNTYTCTITDSRGRTASKTVSVTVVNYSPPSISMSVDRCTSSGAISANGTYLKILINYSFSSVSSKNSITTKSCTCNGVTNTSFPDGSSFVLAANCSAGTSYTVTAYVKDALGVSSPTVKATTGTALRILNVKKNKKGLAIGKICESDKFEVGLPATFFDNIDVTTIEGLGVGRNIASSPHFNKIPVVSSTGVMDIGKYIDFHETANEGDDYKVRLYSDSSGKLLTSGSFQCGSFNNAGNPAWVGKVYCPASEWIGLYNAYNGTRKAWIGHDGTADLYIANSAGLRFMFMTSDGKVNKFDSSIATNGCWNYRTAGTKHWFDKLTSAPSWETRSSEKFKTNIVPFEERTIDTGIRTFALDELEERKPTACEIISRSQIYEYNIIIDEEENDEELAEQARPKARTMAIEPKPVCDVTKKNYGLVIERETPSEILTYNPMTGEPTGIELYGMTSFAWQAIKELTNEVSNLKEVVSALKQQINDLVTNK